MRATPVTASVRVLGRSYPVQGVKLVKRIGATSSGTASIQLATGSTGQPISGDEIADLSATFTDAILNKTDATPNVEIDLLNQLKFEGILLGCQGNINAAGSAVFNISFAEPAIMLNAMNFNCYPSDLPVLSVTAPSEARHPFARKAAAAGPVATRIVQLHKTALESVTSGRGFVDDIFKKQREVNAELDPMFQAVMQRSTDTAPRWMAGNSPVLTTSVNDALCTNLFSSDRNLWQSLMRIAHLFNLIYVGDFERGGYFRQMNLEGDGTDLASAPTQVRNLSLGRNGYQPIGQVAAYAPAKHKYYDPGTITGNTNNGRDRELLAAYPKDPNPKNGKTVTMTAPSWFTIGRTTRARDINRFKVDVKNTADIRGLVAEMRARNAAFNQSQEANYDLIEQWCEDKYNLLRSRNIRASVVKPFTATEYSLGDTATVATGLTGVLSEVMHDVSVQGNTGKATTTYSVAYINTTS